MTPSWVNSVPKNYGEANAGSIKADEWRTLSTIYLPIAFVIMWAEQVGVYAQHFADLLKHTMAIFQATTLVCRYTMTPERAAAYRSHIRYWLENLRRLFPHTKFQNRHRRPNIHAAFHIYDFLLLFGPVISWWSFPFERLIGILQKINTNDHIGGEFSLPFIIWSSMRP